MVGSSSMVGRQYPRRYLVAPRKLGQHGARLGGGAVCLELLVDHQLGEAALQARENRRHFDATTPHLVDFVMVSRTHSPPHKSQSF